MGVSFIEYSFLDASHAAFVGVSFIESIHSLMPPMQPSCLPCSLRGCFIQREHSFLDASHAAFVGVSFRESIHSLMPPMQPSWSHQQCGAQTERGLLSPIMCLMHATQPVFQFYGTAPRCQSQLSWRSARRACGSMATLHTIDTPAGRPTMD